MTEIYKVSDTYKQKPPLSVGHLQGKSDNKCPTPVKKLSNFRQLLECYDWLKSNMWLKYNVFQFGIPLALLNCMTRIPLIHIPFGMYSVVSKCNNNEFLFDSPEKFEMYIKHLIECKNFFKFNIYDIVCMSNHVHELYRVPKKITIAEILKKVKGEFSQKYNRKFGRTGHFWRNKPFYRIVENEEYAFNTMNYFHWNPVRAGLAASPKDWPYSGYRFHILDEKNNLIAELLDSLPSNAVTEPNYEIIKTIEKIMKSQRMRYIGSMKFQRKMRATYGMSVGNPL